MMNASTVLMTPEFRSGRQRIGVPITDTTSLIDQIRYECQFWGGANSSMIPVYADD